MYRQELSRGPFTLWKRLNPSHGANQQAGLRPSQAGSARSVPVAKFPGVQEAVAVAAAGPASQVMTTRRTGDPITEITVEPAIPIPEVDLASVLGSRRWMKCESPFPYVHATEVFEPNTYQSMADQFEGLLSGGRFSRSIPGYDVSAYTITKHTTGPLSIFTSRAWHDMLARMFGVDATGELNVALHHHSVGSQSGSPHNDLNPGWFADQRRSDGIVVHDPSDNCDYRCGSDNPQLPTVERVRAVAVILYLANPPVRYWGGETGLYRATSDPINRPAAIVDKRFMRMVLPFVLIVPQPSIGACGVNMFSCCSCVMRRRHVARLAPRARTT